MKNKAFFKNEKVEIDDQQERLTLYDIGWFVGIIDGEGCFALSRKGGDKHQYFFPIIQITNMNINVINKCIEILRNAGLSYYFYGCLTKLGKPYYRVEVAGIKRCKRFFGIFGEYLTCRRTQARLLESFIDSRLSKTSHSPITEEEIGIAKKLSEINNM